MIANGMIEDDAAHIMKTVIESDTSMRDRWGDSIYSYDEKMVDLIWWGVKQHALRWIDKNIPQAWFRPMFL